MLLDAKKFHLGVNTMMRIAGYKKRKEIGDWVKPYLSGRFHGKLLGKALVEFHYDIYTDEVTHKHFSIQMPLLLTEEKIRIVSLLRSQSTGGTGIIKTI